MAPVKDAGLETLRETNCKSTGASTGAKASHLCRKGSCPFRASRSKQLLAFPVGPHVKLRPQSGHV